MFTKFAHLTNPNKIIRLKNYRFSGTMEDTDANDMMIKCLNFSKNSGWVYIISISGRRQYNKVCVLWMIILISGIDRLIYHHSVYSDNILMCLSQGCDFWYQASYCLQNFVEMPVTTSLWNSNIPIFCFCTVRKRLYAFAIETFTAHAKKDHHHFFDLMRTLYVDINWSNRSAPPISLLQYSKGFSIGT